jgi:galactokinase
MNASDGLKDKIIELQKRRLDAGPRRNVHGELMAQSHEDLADAYERAFDRCDAILGQSIELLFQVEREIK